jgi:hypothetical protein
MIDVFLFADKTIQVTVLLKANQVRSLSDMKVLRNDGTDIDPLSLSPFFSSAQWTSPYSVSSLSVKNAERAEDLSLYVWRT